MFPTSPKSFPYLLLAFLLFHSISAANDTNKTITINATNPTVAPKLNININMSGIGSFKIYLPSQTVDKANENTVMTLGSKWMQRDSEKKLYISVGDSSLGDTVCMYQFWFVKGKHYTLSYTDSNCSRPTCECVSGYGYDEETSHYNSTYLAWAGRSYSYKLGMEIDSFAGRALDGVGPLSVMMQVRVSDGAYVGLTTLEARNLTGLSASLPYYNEYLYTDTNLTLPDERYSTVPQMCLEEEIAKNCSVYPFDYYGNKIVANTSNSSTNGTGNNTKGNGISRLMFVFELCLAAVLMMIFI